MAVAQKISTCLWFDTNAEEAVNFYISLFENSRVLRKSHYGEGAPLPAGTILTIDFELAGTAFMALNGGPHFKFTEAMSMVVQCADQAEIDRLWEGLAGGGGMPVQCGWLKDRFGLSWQIVPDRLSEMMTGPDQVRVDRVMAAILQMVKLDTATLEKAYAG